MLTWLQLWIGLNALYGTCSGFCLIIECLYWVCARMHFCMHVLVCFNVFQTMNKIIQCELISAFFGKTIILLSAFPLKCCVRSCLRPSTINFQSHQLLCYFYCCLLLYLLSRNLSFCFSRNLCTCFYLQ